jgi:hypothetical protein
MKTTTVRAALVAVLMCALPAPTQATIIEFEFSGNVSFIGDPFGLVGSLITLGDPVLVSLRYDTTTPDLYPDDPTRGAYVGPGWLKVNINGLAFEQTLGVQIDVLDGFDGQELFQALGVCCPSPTAWPASLPLFPFSGVGLGIGQTMPPYTLLSSDALPTFLNLGLADFASGAVVSSTEDLNMYEIQFQLFQVPEPGIFALLGTGLLVGVSRLRTSRLPPGRQSDDSN